MRHHWAIIPVKGLRDSKTRLSSYLGEEKKTLVEALLHDVLSSVIKSKVYGTVLVISPDENVAGQARANGASFLRQTGTGLNRGLEQAYRQALKEGAVSTTTVLADIPLAEPEDFSELFMLGAARPKIVLAPSQRGGTNVMMNVPPNAIPPNYGRWSYSRHLRLAQHRALRVYSVSNPRISFDIDTPSDLVELGKRDPLGQTRSGKTVSKLIELRPPVISA